MQAPEADNLDSQDGFDIAAPVFFAAVDLRTSITDSGQLATARVRIVDEAGEPVSGVAVYGVFTADVHINVQAYADASGVANFELAVTDGAPADFEVELVSYEIGGELAYVRPHSVEPGDIATLIERTIEGDGVAEGAATSTGGKETDVEEDPPVSGDSTGGGSSSRTADTSTSPTNPNGAGTSTGFTSDESEVPPDEGAGTSTGSPGLN